jgi:type I site-specific restriction endonuclease
MAVIEAKRFSINPNDATEQVKGYACQLRRDPLLVPFDATYCGAGQSLRNRLCARCFYATFCGCF